MWTIREAQMQSLADEALDTARRRIAAALRVDYPELPWRMGEAGYLAWVDEVIDGGVALGLELEESLAQFVEWHARSGPDASFAEEHPWAIDVLRDPSVDEGERVRAVDLGLEGLSADGGLA